MDTSIYFQVNIHKNKVSEESNMITGGYTKFRPLNEEEQAIFDEATKGIVGVDYEPLLVATQVVAGTNYKYICNACLVSPEPICYGAEVIIFKPLPGQGDPVITSIREI